MHKVRVVSATRRVTRYAALRARAWQSWLPMATTQQRSSFAPPFVSPGSRWKRRELKRTATTGALCPTNWKELCSDNARARRVRPARAPQCRAAVPCLPLAARKHRRRVCRALVAVGRGQCRAVGRPAQTQAEGGALGTEVRLCHARYRRPVLAAPHDDVSVVALAGQVRAYRVKRDAFDKAGVAWRRAEEVGGKSELGHTLSVCPQPAWHARRAPDSVATLLPAASQT